MNWTKAKTLSFIKLIRNRPVIWDPSTQENMDRSNRKQAIEEVSKLTGLTFKEVNSKWASLRGQYMREQKRMAHVWRSTGGDVTPTSKWFAYKNMDYLMAPKLAESMHDDELINAEEEQMPSKPEIPNIIQTPIPPPPTTTPMLLAFTPFGPPVTPAPHVSLPRNHLSEVPEQEEQDNPSTNQDDISAFGSYVAAQLRKFNPRLQCKAKLEINKVLFNLEAEYIEQTFSSTVETKQSLRLSNEEELPQRSSLLDPVNKVINVYDMSENLSIVKEEVGYDLTIE